MSLDEFSALPLVVSVILGLLVVVIVGSQPREDARFVARWTFRALVPLLAVSCVRMAFPYRDGGLWAGSGMVSICAALIAAVALGHRISSSGPVESSEPSKASKDQTGGWDDELA